MKLLVSERHQSGRPRSSTIGIPRERWSPGILTGSPWFKGLLASKPFQTPGWRRIRKIVDPIPDAFAISQPS